MSQENVETVERAIAAINARDIAGYLECCTADIELLTPMAAIGGEYAGADGIKRFLTDIEDAGPSFRIELERVEALGADIVIAFVLVRSRGRASGIATETDGANVYDFADGRIRRVRIFWDHAEALKAAGLEA